jgi:quercetin dioxygenase-like cupin family protein
MHNAPPVDWNSMPWESVREGVDRKLCNGAQATMAMHRVSRTAVTVAHAHPEEQFVYVLDGQLDYAVESTTYALGPGDVLRIPPNVVHRSQTVSEQPAITLDVFVPRREY